VEALEITGGDFVGSTFGSTFGSTLDVDEDLVSPESIFGSTLFVVFGSTLFVVDEDLGSPNSAFGATLYVVDEALVSSENVFGSTRLSFSLLSHSTHFSHQGLLSHYIRLLCNRLSTLGALKAAWMPLFPLGSNNSPNNQLPTSMARYIHWIIHLGGCRS